jgi:glycosyltransferase involved in cell wall biosynthesis
VAQSFFKQKKVDEIIFVNDGGSDNTKQIIYKINLKYPQVKVKYIKNKKK